MMTTLAHFDPGSHLGATLVGAMLAIAFVVIHLRDLFPRKGGGA